MRPCPYCAEPIQASAALCRYCGNRVAPAAPMRRGGAARPLRQVERVVGVGAFLLVGYLLAVQAGLVSRLDLSALELPSPRETAEFFATPVFAEPPPPLELAILDPGELELSSGEYVNAAFVVRDPRPCFLTGRITGVAGGSRDLEVYVLDEIGYDDWRSGVRPMSLYASGRAAATTLGVELPGPGRYHLLLSNRYSVLTGKRVRVDEARVRCG